MNFFMAMHISLYVTGGGLSEPLSVSVVVAFFLFFPMIFVSGRSELFSLGSFPLILLSTDPFCFI